MLKFRNVNDYENNLFLDNININSSVISNLNEIKDKKRKVIKIIDILGRSVKNNSQKNTPLFYIHDDGSVVKKVVIQ